MQLRRLWPSVPIGLILRLAERRAAGADRALLLDILRHQRRKFNNPHVIVATPVRFLRTGRIADPSDAIRMMLEFIRTVQQVSAERGIDSRFLVSERIPPSTSGALIFSHHTFRDRYFEKLEESSNEIWHFKAADLPRTLTIDRRGFSGWSSLASVSVEDIPMAEYEEADTFFAQSRKALIVSNTSKYSQPAFQGDGVGRGDRPYVFVAMQTKCDIVQRQAYMPMLTMLDLVVDRFLGTEYDVVIKRHPMCRDEDVTAAICRQLAKSTNVRLSDASIHEILTGASALFTVNSGVGSEAMVYQIPIYCFGGSDYAAIAHQVREPRDLYRLTHPMRLKVDPSKHRRFYHFYRCVYQARVEALPLRIHKIIGTFLE